MSNKDDEFLRYKFKLLLNVKALTNSINKSQDDLLDELLAKIKQSLPDLSPRYFQDHLTVIINVAVAFGWRACKDLVDLEKLIKMIKEEKEKEKYSSFYQ